MLALLERAKGGRMSKFIVRFLGGGLKVKVQEKLVLQALARGFALKHLDGPTPKLDSLTSSIEKAMAVAITQHPSYDHLIKALRDHGPDNLDQVL